MLSQLENVISDVPARNEEEDSKRAFMATTTQQQSLSDPPRSKRYLCLKICYRKMTLLILLLLAIITALEILKTITENTDLKLLTNLILQELNVTYQENKVKMI